ncbi:hypothetical protein RP20_CCG009747 [Aedes albopictus]|nr:hypothetical protein RP20_CCG009747 [Aedes albopictus]
MRRRRLRPPSSSPVGGKIIPFDIEEDDIFEECFLAVCFLHFRRVVIVTDIPPSVSDVCVVT